MQLNFRRCFYLSFFALAKSDFRNTSSIVVFSFSLNWRKIMDNLQLSGKT